MVAVLYSHASFEASCRIAQQYQPILPYLRDGRRLNLGSNEPTVLIGLQAANKSGSAPLAAEQAGT